MKGTLLSGFAVALIGAVVGFAAGLTGLFGGPGEGSLTLALVGFVAGCLNKARRMRYRDRVR
jgi:hypothetical protein